MREWIFEILLRAKHKRLHDGLHALLVAGADKDQNQESAANATTSMGASSSVMTGTSSSLHLLLLAPRIGQIQAP